jgi:hypothetical protein
MMAANYRHIGGGGNSLGRHYSRFSGFWPTAFVVDQSLALRKSRNAGSNRPRRARRKFSRIKAESEYGAAEFLTKPVDFDQLKIQLRELPNARAGGYFFSDNSGRASHRL